MGDMIDMWRDHRAHKRELRARYGISCPECPRHRPRAQPTILMPGQRCRVDGYRDPRPELTPEQLGYIVQEGNHQ